MKKTLKEEIRKDEEITAALIEGVGVGARYEKPYDKAVAIKTTLKAKGFMIVRTPTRKGGKV